MLQSRLPTGTWTPALTGADIVILAVLLVSMLLGLLRGFVKEVFSLANWTLALLLAYGLHAPFGAVLPMGAAASPALRSTLAALLIFFATLIVGGLIGAAAYKLVRVSGLSGTDRTLGSIFGLGRGAVIVLALLALLPGLSADNPMNEQAWWQASALIPLFLSVEPWAAALWTDILAWLGQLFD